jgi:diadenosine tetraphosphate (Ap4A) HIT family hydrolase
MATPAFTLHPQLAGDCHLVGNLTLSTVLLLDDRRYPWVVLVPRVTGISELFELDQPQRHRLLDESCRLGAWMMDHFQGGKLNVAALGNLVPQLHLHHVVRHPDDPAWPGPVWGHSPRVPYTREAGDRVIEALREGLRPDLA